MFYLSLPQHFQTHFRDKQLLLRVMIIDVYFIYVWIFLYLFIIIIIFGEPFTDLSAVFFFSVYCPSFPSDHLSECLQWLDGTWLTAAPKTPNQHLMTPLLRAEIRNADGARKGLMSREMVMFKYINTIGTPLLLTICNQLHQRDTTDATKMKAATVKQNYTCLINAIPHKTYTEFGIRIC